MVNLHAIYPGRASEPKQTQSENKELDSLLSGLAKAKMIIYRLEGESTMRYPANHPVLVVIRNYYKELLDLNERLTAYFERLQDERGDTNINGRLSLKELYRRRDNCDRRIKELEGREKIISIADYQIKKSIEDEPKGA